MAVGADANNLSGNADFASDNLLSWVAFAESAFVIVGHSPYFRSGSLALSLTAALRPSSVHRCTNSRKLRRNLGIHS